MKTQVRIADEILTLQEKDVVYLAGKDFLEAVLLEGFYQGLEEIEEKVLVADFFQDYEAEIVLVVDFFQDYEIEEVLDLKDQEDHVSNFFHDLEVDGSVIAVEIIVVNADAVKIMITTEEKRFDQNHHRNINKSFQVLLEMT